MKLTKLQINKIKNLHHRITKLDDRFQINYDKIRYMHNSVVDDLAILVDDLFSTIEEILGCEEDEK
jgi:hypothetical protein